MTLAIAYARRRVAASVRKPFEVLDLIENVVAADRHESLPVTGTVVLYSSVASLGSDAASSEN